MQDRERRAPAESFEFKPSTARSQLEDSMALDELRALVGKEVTWQFHREDEHVEGRIESVSGQILRSLRRGEYEPMRKSTSTDTQSQRRFVNLRVGSSKHAPMGFAVGLSSPDVGITLMAASASYNRKCRRRFRNRPSARISWLSRQRYLDTEGREPSMCF